MYDFGREVGPENQVGPGNKVGPPIIIIIYMYIYKYVYIYTYVYMYIHIAYYLLLLATVAARVPGVVFCGDEPDSDEEPSTTRGGRRPDGSLIMEHRG